MLVRRTLLTSIAGSLTLGVAACGGAERTDAVGSAASAGAGTSTSEPAEPATSEPTATRSAAPARGQVKLIADDLNVPWDIDFLPGGDAVVTERNGKRIVRIPAGGGEPKTVRGIPGVSAGTSGEGGLLGIAVSPKYASDHLLYVYFTTSKDNRIATVNTETNALKVIKTGIRKGQNHNGGALSFGPDGKLYVGVGEVYVTNLAQDPKSSNGKILRLEPSGKPAKGNPLGDNSPVWSLGHRNVQGFDWDAQGRMWASEFGQNETDEVNLIRKGKNYGWPVVEGVGNTQSGKYTNPVVTWTPTSSSSPSGAAVAGKELYVGALAGRALFRIPLNGAKAGKPVALFQEEYGRIRAVATAPDGSVWFATSNRDGRGDPADADDRIFQLGVK